MLREAAWRVAPGVMADRAARYERALRSKWGLPGLADEFIAKNGDRVLHGPFQGMRYWRGGDAAVAKLLGVYEVEILPWIAEAVAAQPPTFVDIGAADGFYAVGVALASPQTDVVAFELSATARGELQQLAGLNEAKIAVRGRATARALRALPLSGGLVLCDIEGAEADVLQPIPQLADATLIVELHEPARPGVTDLLRERFEPTHSFEIAHKQKRESAPFPELEGLSRPPLAALSEHRARGMAWARFLPRTGRA